MPKTTWLAIGGIAAATTVGAYVSVAQDMPPFGDEQSVSYAQQLWQSLETSSLVGDGALRSTVYEGTEPHGVILEQIEGTVTVGDQEGIVVVKRNYGAEDLSGEDVVNAPIEEFLGSTTVMFKREAGYAPDSADWFWAKYLPGGALDQTPDGVPLAGRVQGCIGCHGGAEGGDFVFLHDRYAGE